MPQQPQKKKDQAGPMPFMMNGPTKLVIHTLIINIPFAYPIVSGNEVS